MELPMYSRMSSIAAVLLLVALQGNAFQFSITYPSGKSTKPLDGRLLLLISTDSTREPRFQLGDGPKTQQVFGINVEAWKAGDVVNIGANGYGYPKRSITDIPPGEYWVQVLLHRYETFKRSDGHTVKLPMDRGEGQQWNRAPGNLYSTPRKLYFDHRRKNLIPIVLDQEIPPIEQRKDTKYIKHIRIRSERLSTFWGRDMYLGANVLLPWGWDEHPEARYPLAVFHGHFSPTFGGFREEPPDPNLKPDYSERFRLEGYNRIQQEFAYEFYKEWTGPGYPRFIAMEVQHANPYYDDSYAVNSENLGPYGDAIMYELIPYVEKTFRGIGEGWARFTYGGSTGGWEALAVQVKYPDEFNGCWAACPDPIDFRAFTVVNIYDDDNAYYMDSRWKKTPRPGKRNYRNEIEATLQEVNQLELALGDKSRSGQQWDIWEAVYSPVGKNGYPKRIWDKESGVIDKEVAEYWKQNYDLGYILKRDWKTLGPKLQGKINIYVGEMDNYYLNNAVRLMEGFLQTTKDPFYGGEVDYECLAEHCWNGDHANPIWISRLQYVQFHTPKMMERIRVSAPKGADAKSWRY